MLGDADRDVVARDTALPGLATVLDRERLAALLLPVEPQAEARHVELHYIKYKPGQSCLAGVRVGTAAGESRFCVRAYSTGLDSKWDDIATRGGGRGASVVLDASRRIAVARFPDDPGLRGPRWLLTADTGEAAQRKLGLGDGPVDVRLLVYKPERRMVARVSREGRPVAVVKCYEPTGYARARLVHDALGATLPIPVPVATSWSDRWHVIASRWIEGDSCTYRSTPLDAFRQVGETLAELHGSALRGLPVRDSAGEAERFRRLTDDLSHMQPALAPSLARLQAALRDAWFPAAPSVPLHGDFYIKQILITQGGIGLLDFDEAALGDPLVDLGLFLAHMERDACRGEISAARAEEITQAFLGGYATQRPFDGRRLPRAVAHGLWTLIPHPFRHRAPNWPLLMAAMVERALQLLASVPRASVGDAARLAADPALAFAAPLLDAETAADVLRPVLTDAGLDGMVVRRPRLLRHKPGRRCLIAWDVRQSSTGDVDVILGKVRAKGISVRSANVHRALWDSGLSAGSADGVAVPRPLGVVQTWRLMLQSRVPGVSVLTALAQGASETAVAGAVAHGLHRLHTSGVRPHRSWTIADELTMLRERLANLQAVRPSLRPQLARVSARLTQLAEPLYLRTTSACVHRDFYHDQVLLDGERVTLVDLDLCAFGDPAMDLGNFIAHIIDVSWRGQLDAGTATALNAGVMHGYATRDLAISSEAVARWTYLSLARLVEIAGHHDDRRDHVARLLSLLDGALQRKGCLDLDRLIAPEVQEVAS